MSVWKRDYQAERLTFWRKSIIDHGFIERMQRQFGREAPRFMDAWDRQLANNLSSPGLLYRRLARLPEMARLVSSH